MPDNMRFDIDDIFEAGERVVMRFTLRGTHRGELRGSRPARSTDALGINIYRLDQGKITETNSASHSGLTPTLAPMSSRTQVPRVVGT
jgi:predicted ester cyclase